MLATDKDETVIETAITQTSEIVSVPLSVLIRMDTYPTVKLMSKARRDINTLPGFGQIETSTRQSFIDRNRESTRIYCNSFKHLHVDLLDPTMEYQRVYPDSSKGVPGNLGSTRSTDMPTRNYGTRDQGSNNPIGWIVNNNIYYLCWQLSLPGYNETEDQALLYVSRFGGGAGSGWLSLMSLTEGKWSIIAETPVWMS